MMVAAREGHEDVVRYLLNEGAPWNAVDVKCRCAGDFAALSGHQRIVDMIMDHAVTSELLLSAWRNNGLEFLPVIYLFLLSKNSTKSSSFLINLMCFK